MYAPNAPLYTPIHTLLKAEECIECEKGTFANAYESHTCTDCDAGKCLFNKMVL